MITAMAQNQRRRGGFTIRTNRPPVDLPELGGKDRKRQKLLNHPVSRSLQLTIAIATAILASFAISYAFYLFMLLDMGVKWQHAIKFPFTK